MLPWCAGWLHFPVGKRVVREGAQKSKATELKSSITLMMEQGPVVSDGPR